MSNNIKEGILRALDSKDNFKWHASMVKKIEEQSSPELQAALESLVKSEGEKKNAIGHESREAQAIELIGDFILRFSPEEQQSIIHNLIEIIKKSKTERWQEIRQAMYTLKTHFQQTKLTSEDQKELLDRLFELLRNSNLAPEAFNLAIKLISFSDKKADLASQTVEKIINSHSSLGVRFEDAVLKIIIPIIPMVKEPKTITQVIDNAVSRLDLDSYELACYIGAAIAVTAKSDQITSHILSSLRKYDTRFTDRWIKGIQYTNSFNQVIKYKGDQRLINQAFEHFVSLLSSPDPNVIISGLRCLQDLGEKIEDKNLLESVFDSVIPFLESEHHSVQSSVIYVLEGFCYQDKALVAKAVDKLMLCMNKYDISGLEIAGSIKKISSWTKDKIMAKKIIEKSTELINIDNNIAKKMGLDILTGVAEAVEDKEVAVLVLEKMYAILFEENSSVMFKVDIGIIGMFEQNTSVRLTANRGATNVLNTMKDPELSTMILEKFINVVMNDENVEKKKVALSNSTLVLESSDKEKTLSRLHNVILNVLSNENKELRAAAIGTVQQLLTSWSDHSIPTPIVENLLGSLNDDDSDVKEAAFKAVSRFPVQGNEELGFKILDKLLTFVVQEDKNIQKTAIAALKDLTRWIYDKETATNTFEKIMEIFPIKEDSVKQAVFSDASFMYSRTEKNKISSKTVDRIEEFMFDDNKEVRDNACNIAKGMIEAGEPKILKKLIGTMQNFGELDGLKKVNVLDLSSEIEWKSEQKQLIIEFLSKIVDLLSADDFYLRLAATKTFENAIKTFKDQDLAVKGIDSIRNALKKLGRNYSQLENAAGIVRIVEDRKKVTPLLDELIEQGLASDISLMLTNEDSDLAIYVLANLGKQAGGTKMEVIGKLVRSFLLPFKECMQLLFKHSEKKVRETSEDSAIYAFKWKLLENISLMEQMIKPSMELDIKTLKKKLFDSEMKAEVQSELEAALALYIQNPLTENLDKIRHILLSQLNQIGDKKGYQLIEIALSLIGFEEVLSGDEHRKEVVDVARQVINLEIKYLDQEGLRWIADNLSSLTGLSKETKSFCKKLCHKILEDFEITDAEKELLIKFVSLGLTISISRTGDIIFEGKRYTIQNKNSGPLLEEIAKAVVDQNRDLLALQYKEHKPIFPKRCNGGMKQATADIEEIQSLVDRTNKLSNDVWSLTKLENEGQEIVLLEQRSAIGDHLIYLISEKKLVRTNPQDSNKERERIFGKYIAGKKYQGSCSTLDFSQGNEIITKEKPPEMKKATTNIIYFQQELLGLGNSDRIESIQSELDKKLSDYNKVLESKLKDEKLPPADEEKVKEYYHAFVGTFASAYTSAQVINSGQVQLDAGDNRVKVLSTLVSFAPFVGDTLSSMITSVSEFMQSREMIKNARKMKDMAVDAVALSQLVGDVAYKIVMDKNKQQEIFIVKDEDMQKITGSLLEKINKVYNLVGEKIDDFLYTKKFKTAPAKLGNNDANELIEQWIQEKIQLKNIQAQFISIATKNNSGGDKGVAPPNTQKVEEADAREAIVVLCFRPGYFVY